MKHMRKLCKAIYAVLSSSDVTDEDLITVVTGAESFLISRPLTFQSANVKDDVPLGTGQ